MKNKLHKITLNQVIAGISILIILDFLGSFGLGISDLRIRSDCDGTLKQPIWAIKNLFV